MTIIEPVLIGMLLILPSAVFMLDAAAQPSTAHVASGSGSGTLTCPTGETGPATIVFGVSQYRNYQGMFTGIDGNYHIASPQPIGGIDGILTDGHVGEKSFRVTGAELVGFSCHGFNSDMVISAKCGTDVAILYKAEDKVVGRFTGDVNCFTR